MKVVGHLTLLVICIIVTDSSVNSKFNDNAVSRYYKDSKKTIGDLRTQDDFNSRDLDSDSDGKVLEKGHDKELRLDVENADYDKKRKKNEEVLGNKYNFNDDEVEPNHALEDEDEIDSHAAKSKIKHIKEYRRETDREQTASLTPRPEKNIANSFFHIDNVLNAFGSKPNYKSEPLEDFRRKAKVDTSSSSLSSSSREMKDFKDEFREVWLHKKYEALNNTIPRGDNVNMLAARPWGVPCGDPNQHDMPWGSCMMPAECEPEFRIYRGDLFCGRTQFVCCAIQISTYDTYQGFDVSFDEKSLSTDTDEKKDRDITSKENRKRKKQKEQNRRKKNREKRKKKIRKHIKKIVKEIKKILNKQYKNGTRQRKKRTKQLKKFIKDLKKQYKKDRQSVKDIHENDMIHIDKALLDRLKQIKSVNNEFVRNETFRQVLLNGTITKKAARMLLEAYPELDEFLEARRAGGDMRRARGGDTNQGNDQMLEYDVEYGYLYY